MARADTGAPCRAAQILWPDSFQFQAFQLFREIIFLDHCEISLAAARSKISFLSTELYMTGAFL